MEGYEPSEASIEWNVTTVEGFDRDGGNVMNFSALASDIVDVTLMRLERQQLGSGGFGDCENDGYGNGNGSGRRQDGLLMSCRRQPTLVKKGYEKVLSGSLHTQKTYLRHTVLHPTNPEWG